MPEPQTPLLRKAFDAHLVKTDEAEGIIEAIASVFGVVDSYGERVVPGAFAKSLSKKLPKGVWMHDWAQPVARTIEAYELAPGDTRLPESIREFGGLYVKGKFNLKTQRGREAFSDVQEGIIDEFSIGYWLIASERAEDNVLDLTEIDLAEWSPVLRGANPATELVNVRAAHGGAPHTDFREPQSGLRLCEHAAQVRESVEALIERAQDVAAKRQAKGKARPLGDSTTRELRALADLSASLRDLTKEPVDEVGLLRLRNALRKHQMEVTQHANAS